MSCSQHFTIPHNMMAFVNLFGGVLDSNTQKVNTADILGGKVVGIYFGANGARSAEHLPNICGIITTIKKPRYAFVSSCSINCGAQGSVAYFCCPPPPPPSLPKNRWDSRRAPSDAEVCDIGVQYSPDSEELLISDTRQGGLAGEGWG